MFRKVKESPVEVDLTVDVESEPDTPQTPVKPSVRVLPPTTKEKVKEEPQETFMVKNKELRTNAEIDASIKAEIEEQKKSIGKMQACAISKTYLAKKQAVLKVLKDSLYHRNRLKTNGHSLITLNKHWITHSFPERDLVTI